MLSGQKDYTLSRKSILRMKLGEFNPTILDEVVLTLQGAELLVEVSEGSEVSYRLTTKCLEMYQILKQNKAVR
jgi:hypothetical protein